MFNARLFTILEPKAQGKNPRLYYVEGNHFSTQEEDGHIFTSKEEVEEVQDKFDFDLQLDYLEG